MRRGRWGRMRPHHRTAHAPFGRQAACGLPRSAHARSGRWRMRHRNNISSYKTCATPLGACATGTTAVTPSYAKMSAVAKQTHHKHSSRKDYRRLLDTLAEHEAVHRLATGRVKPRMGSGRPIAPISKVRRVDSGLSITINADGAIIDAYVVTDRPDDVIAFMRAQDWTR